MITQRIFLKPETINFALLNKSIILTKKGRLKMKKEQNFSEPKFTPEQKTAALVVLICILGIIGIVLFSLIKFALTGG